MKLLAIVLSLASACVMPPVAPAPIADPPASAPGPDNRRISFNARPLDETGWRIVAALDTYYRRPLPDGHYWYDARSGLAGVWGGPAGLVLPVGMPMGPLPANASGGGTGYTTGVFVNGRELHPADIALLASFGIAAWRGRWWTDGAGNFGPEGGRAWGNLFVLARTHGGGGGGGGGGGSWTRGYGAGSTSFWAGGDGNGYNWAMDGASGCSYASDGGGVMC